MNETFGEEVKRRRLALVPKVSQAKLAELSGVSMKTIGGLELGKVETFRSNTERAVSAALAELEGTAAKRQAAPKVKPTPEASRDSGAFVRWLDTTGHALGYRDDASLARALGIHQYTVSRWKTRHSQPAVEHLARVGELFGTDLKALLVMAGYVTAEQANLPPHGPWSRPPLPDGCIAVAADDVLTILHGPIRDPEAFMAAAKRLHLACLPDAEILPADEDEGAGQ